MPRTDTVTTTVYTFDELSDEAKEKARNWWREGGLDYDWWDSVYDDCDTIFKIIGITSDKIVKPVDGAPRRTGPCIWFSDFYSQGDGACFEGIYSYAKGAGKAIRKYAPEDTELHRIVDELQALQRKYLYKLEARVRHIGYYHYENSVQIEVTRNGYEADADPKARVAECLRDLMRWIYRQLKEEYEYLNSDESVDETIRANEYEFTEDGKHYRKETEDGYC